MGKTYLVAKTDPITFVADDIGYYSVCVNANDIACMGARPRWFLATILLPAFKTTVASVEKIFQQIHHACRAFGVSFCGGHTEATRGLDRPIVVGHMMGEVAKEKLVTTRGARIGDDVILTKGIALEATSIIARERSPWLQKKYPKDFLLRCRDFIYKPGLSVLREAQLALGVGGVHAFHDPTEGGLSSGLYEIAQAARLGMVIDEEKIPIISESRLLCQDFGLNPLGVISSGALLIVANPKRSSKIVSRLVQAGIAASWIGRIVSPEKGLLLLTRDGSRVSLPKFSVDEITKLFN